MKNQYILTLFNFFLIGLYSIAQPYVVNEKVTKVFSEGFTDVNDKFEITSSSDSKFWGTYGDGFYYMERKIASPRAIVVNADPVSKNFYIKSKILLGPGGNGQSSVGILFLAQTNGKGGFVFEINKKKSFRIQDIGTGAFITKEGTDGWLKSKSIAPATRNNTVEIKGFRGEFDIYINGAYIYSFVNSSYKKGKFGTYIGPNANAKIYYYNVYELEIPGTPPEVNIQNLYDEIESLKIENDSLKTLALTTKFGGNDKAAIIAIKVLEEQLKAVNEENYNLKNILKEYENSDPKLDSASILKDQNFTNGMVERISKLSEERDSVIESINPIRSKLFDVSYQRDSLREINLKLEIEMSLLEENMKEIQLEINELRENSISDSLINIPKEPSNPSKMAVHPIIPNSIPITPSTKPSLDTNLVLILNVEPEVKIDLEVEKETEIKTEQEQEQQSIPDTVGVSIMVKKDSTYSHTMDIDEEIGGMESDAFFGDTDLNQSDSTKSEEALDSLKIEVPKKIKILPLRKQKIKVQKAIKAEFKD